MGVKLIELRPDRNLIKSNFDGYKLSLEPVPVTKLTLDGKMVILINFSCRFSAMTTNLTNYPTGTYQT